MLKKSISVCLTAVMLLVSAISSSAVSAQDFTDVSVGDWFYTYVDEVSQKGYMIGMTDTTFVPNGNVTRAMSTEVLSRVENADLSIVQANDAFSDVSNIAWYAKSVSWANIQKLVQGYEDGTFKPDNDITRQEAATIIDRYITGKNYVSGGYVKTFTDEANIGDYAKASVNKCVEYGLILGYPEGTFGPERTITRAEFAAIIARLDTLLKGPTITPTGPAITTPGSVTTPGGTSGSGSGSGGGGGGGGGVTPPTTTTEGYIVVAELNLTGTSHGVALSSEKFITSISSIGVMDPSSDPEIETVLRSMADSSESITSLNNATGEVLKSLKGHRKDIANINVSGGGVVSAVAYTTSPGGVVTASAIIDKATVKNLLQTDFSVAGVTDPDIDGAYAKLASSGIINVASFSTNERRAALIIATAMSTSPNISTAFTTATGISISDSAVFVPWNKASTIVAMLGGTPVPGPIIPASEKIEISIDLDKLFPVLDNYYGNHRNAAVNKWQNGLGVTLTGADRLNAEAIYDLFKPTNLVTVGSSTDRAVTLKNNTDYTNIIRNALHKTADFMHQFNNETNRIMSWNDAMNKVATKTPINIAGSTVTRNPSKDVNVLSSTTGMLTFCRSTTSGSAVQLITGSGITYSGTDKDWLASLVGMGSLSSFLPSTSASPYNGPYDFTVKVSRVS